MCIPYCFDISSPKVKPKEVNIKFRGNQYGKTLPSLATLSIPKQKGETDESLLTLRNSRHSKDRPVHSDIPVPLGCFFGYRRCLL